MLDSSIILKRNDLSKTAQEDFMASENEANALEPGYEDRKTLLEKRTEIRTWTMKQHMDAATARRYAADMWPFLSVVIFLLSGVLGAVGAASVTKGNPLAWFLFAFLPLGSWLGVSLWRRGRLNGRKAAEESWKYTKELHEFACRLLAAIDEYDIHCKRFHAWCTAVKLGLREKNEALGGRYRVFLTRAHDRLRAHEDNLQNMIAVAEQQKKFAADHPGFDQVGASALASVLTHGLPAADDPTQDPLLDLSVALETESALRELVSDGERPALLGSVPTAP